MTVRESKTERACKAWARRRGALAIKLVGEKGIPDNAFILLNGRLLVAEFKRVDKEPTEIQAYRLEQFAKRHVTVAVIKSVQQFKKIYATLEKIQIPKMCG